jgi:hypothetical protein
VELTWKISQSVTAVITKNLRLVIYKQYKHYFAVLRPGKSMIGIDHKEVVSGFQGGFLNFAVSRQDALFSHIAEMVHQ